MTVLMAACGGGGGSEGDDDPAGPDAGMGVEPDTTAPTVLAISPVDGAGGVRADTVVVIEFSEPMDQLSVQNSVDTSDLGGVTFAWSDGGATLTITPDEPLVYATGEGLNPGSVWPNRYVVTLGTGAADEAGNALAAGEQTSFTTLKAMTTSFSRDNTLTGAGTPGGVTTDADDFLYIGDDALGGASSGYRGYITIDLEALPASAVGIASATLRGYQLAEINMPYAALGGGTGVILDHATFMLGSEAQDNAAFNLTPHSQVGVFATAGALELAIDVTAQVQDDLANRATRSSRSQYRLRLSSFTNLDATANYLLIGRDELSLEVVYLAP